MNNDISALFERIQQNIAAVEQGERCAAVLDEIKADCIQMLELMKLFLISERDSYYGYFLMNLTYDVDFSSRSIAGILLERFPPVFLSAPEGHISSAVLKKMFKLRSVRPLESYLYYFQLIRNKPLPERAQQPQRMLLAVGDAGEGENESDESIITTGTCGKPTDHEWNASEDAEEATAAMRDRCRC